MKRNVRFWHNADITIVLTHVRFRVLTLRTPIRSYAVIGRMGLGVAAGNEKLPGDAHAGGFYFGDN
jgi:hypothetical protein